MDSFPGPQIGRIPVVPPPRTVIGRYSVIRLLGKGGMGEVFKAVDPQNNREVAIKILDAEAYRDEELLRRFEREAHSAFALDHPNIARFYGLEQDEEGRPIIVMEFIDGTPMDQLIKQSPDIPFSRLLDYAIQTARGLENAYRRSIIHRDIKPANIIVTRDNVVKIIDFGLAKSLWDTSGLTGTGMVVGTPRYISPEQGMGKSVDHRSDIYSLGATLYELVTRQAPYDGDTPLTIMMKHINSPLVPPYMINPKVPGDISEIVIRMLAKDPKERFQEYEPLIRDLESAKIHRLAKERRTGTEATLQFPSASSSRQEDRGRAIEPTFVSRPSSYLSEGLVHLDFSNTREAEPANTTKIVLLSLAGVLVIGFAVAALMQPREVEGARKTSWLSKKLSAVMGDPTGDPAAESPESLAKDDAAKVALTQSRMEAVISAIIDDRVSKGPAARPSIKELEKSGAFTDENLRDAWGNKFYIIDTGTGGGTLVGLGRDSFDKTDDDFKFSLDGSPLQVPDALDVKHFKEDGKKDAEE